METTGLHGLSELASALKPATLTLPNQVLSSVFLLMMQDHTHRGA